MNSETKTYPNHYPFNRLVGEQKAGEIVRDLRDEGQCDTETIERAVLNCFKGCEDETVRENVSILVYLVYNYRRKIYLLQR